MCKEDLDKLINDLSEKLEPVKALAHPLVRIAPFFIVAIIYVGTLVYFVGFRADIAEKFTDLPWMMEIFLMAFLGLSAAIASSFLSIPDSHGQKWIIAPPLTTLSIFIVWNILRTLSEGLHMPSLQYGHCMGEGAFMAALPMTMFIFMMQRGATTRPRMAALMNVLAASALGYVGLRFTCMMDTVGHATLSHIVPYVLVGALLAVAAKKLYKW